MVQFSGKVFTPNLLCTAIWIQEKIPNFDSTPAPVVDHLWSESKLNFLTSTPLLLHQNWVLFLFCRDGHRFGVRLHFAKKFEAGIGFKLMGKIRSRIRFRYEWYGVFRMYVKPWQRWAQTQSRRILKLEAKRMRILSLGTGVNFSDSAHLCCFGKNVVLKFAVWSFICQVTSTRR